MILTVKNRKHAEAIVQHCTDNAMAIEATMGLWNHLVYIFKHIEILELLLVESNEVLRSASQVADRYGRETNWQTLQTKLSEVLGKQHKLTNKIRNRAADEAESAPKAPNKQSDEIIDKILETIDLLLGNQEYLSRIGTVKILTDIKGIIGR